MRIPRPGQALALTSSSCPRLSRRQKPCPSLEAGRGTGACGHRRQIMRVADCEFVCGGGASKVRAVDGCEWLCSVVISTALWGFTLNESPVGVGKIRHKETCPNSIFFERTSATQPPPPSSRALQRCTLHSCSESDGKALLDSELDDSSGPVCSGRGIRASLPCRSYGRVLGCTPRSNIFLLTQRQCSCAGKTKSGRDGGLQ